MGTVPPQEPLLPLVPLNPPPPVHPAGAGDDDDDDSAPSSAAMYPSPESLAPVRDLAADSLVVYYRRRGRCPPHSSSDEATVAVPKNAGTGRGRPPTQALVADVPAKKKRPRRSAEIVRVNGISGDDDMHSRHLVRRARITYESLRRFLAASGEGGRRPDLRALQMMCDAGLLLQRDHRIVGAVPGVQVGDVFLYRAELIVVGLHGLVQGGIDYVPASKDTSGKPLATSIVVSGGYEDDDDRGNVIIYTGQGGKEHNRTRLLKSQTLSRGNLALERSMNYGIEVRVVRGSKSELSPSGMLYVYDGLYKVTDCWTEVGKSGFEAYKFKLQRMEGQNLMGSIVLKSTEALKKKLDDPNESLPMGYMSIDMSGGTEPAKVSLFNDIDGDEEPLACQYLVRPLYPAIVLDVNSWSNAMRQGGCRCASGCSASSCLCAHRNGGAFAYDATGNLLKGKPLIYECGPLCGCPPSCLNRVSQKGITHRLEVFRSMDSGWEVRSFDFIRAGSFVCELVGHVLPEADDATLHGHCLIHPGQLPSRWAEWGDLTDLFADYKPPEFPRPPRVDFSIDMSKSRNAANYLTQNPLPNLFVQYVLYDHYNESYPHLMVFALENIPPFRRLTIDYGFQMGHFICQP